MAVDETRIALMQREIEFLTKREAIYHDRIGIVEDVAGRAADQVEIVAGKVKRHEKILTGNGEEGLTEQVRKLRGDFAELRQEWKEESERKVKQYEKVDNRKWDVTIAVILFIFTELVRQWLLGQ